MLHYIHYISHITYDTLYIVYLTRGCAPEAGHLADSKPAAVWQGSQSILTSKEYHIKRVQNGARMHPKWTPDCSKMTPWRPLGASWRAPWQPLGASWAPEGIWARFWPPFWTPFWHHFWAQLGQEPFPASLFRLLSPPRALQEALQRLSEGLYVEDAIWNQFWTGLGSDFGAPGPLKVRFSCERYCTFCDFACFSRDSILDPFWTLPGSLLGAFWHLRWLKPVLEFVLDRPRPVQDYFLSAPRGKKEGSKKESKI